QISGPPGLLIHRTHFFLIKLRKECGRGAKRIKKRAETKAMAAGAGTGGGTATGAKAVAIIAGDTKVRGFIQFIQQPTGATLVAGKITGLSPGFHGFHIHALGDTTNGCNSTGPHFNPLKKSHGSPWDHERHAGDLGNILANENGLKNVSSTNLWLKFSSPSLSLLVLNFSFLCAGVAEISIEDTQIPLAGPNSILGRAVVVHADPDDLGKGGHELSKATGNAGARVGCGIPHMLLSKPWS
ncbi:unnamed protein product, partial [Linum tenue]